MRSLIKPSTCHSENIVEVSREKRQRTYPHLIKLGLRAARAAAHYDANNGNPLIIRPYSVSPRQKAELEYLFGSPPKHLAYITEMRNKHAGETCPMCGGLDPVSLDHFLPRRTHAEFLLLSYNLVPACSCNSRKGDVVADYNTKQRLLHPYYDSCLDKPLFVCDFDPALKVPTFTPRILLAPTDSKYPHVEFHIKNVILKTSILTYLGKRWDKLKELTDDLLINNRAHRTNRVQFQSYLLGLAISRGRVDGANCWEAIFFRSVAERCVSDWIFNNT